MKSLSTIPLNGLSLACRYAYPPNSLSLCGPEKQPELSWYSQSLQTDNGSKEILQQFSTLYPYLCFIAGENNIKDPFLHEIVEAYWLGNNLLQKTNSFRFQHFIDDTLNLSKKTPKKTVTVIKQKITEGALPHHAFHVLNMYKRTGNLNETHTVQTMDACIINAGKIVTIERDHLIVETKPLQSIEGILMFGNHMRRKLRFQTQQDSIVPSLSINDWVSYHWGYVCQKISLSQRTNLSFYTNLALRFAQYEKENSNYR